jgi:hypothetical protein
MSAGRCRRRASFGKHRAGNRTDAPPDAADRSVQMVIVRGGRLVVEALPLSSV